MSSTMPWHAGARRVQERVGEAHLADRLAAGIRTEVPPDGAAFLGELPQVVVASTDADGLVWVTALTGPPGFLAVPTPDVLTIAANPGDGDPLRAALAAPAHVGLLGLEPATRTRVRLNGRSAPIDGDGDGGAGLEVALDEVFGNCPKHIVPRVVVDDEGATSSAARSTRGLDDDLAARLAAADTVFVGTTDGQGRADASHRGGPPGFVEVVDATHLRFPDYRGNSMYQTLGNVDAHPAIGLLVPDWSTGAALHLTGWAEIDFEPSPALRERFPRAPRIVTVELDGAIDRPAAFPLRWWSRPD